MSNRTKAEIWSDWRCKKDGVHLAHDIDADRMEKIAGLLDEVKTLRAALSRERERHQDLLDFVQLTEHKLDQRLQGQYTNTQILGMLLKLSRELLLKHKLPAPVTGEGD